MVAVFIDEPHAPRGEDFAGLLVPADRIGAQRPVAVAQHDVAAGGHDIAIGTVFEDIGFEVDRAVAGRIQPVIAGGGGRRVQPGAGIGYGEQIVGAGALVQRGPVGLRVAGLALRVDDVADIVGRALRSGRAGRA